METLEIRDLVKDEVEYRNLDPAVIDKAIAHIKNSRLIETIDMVVDTAIAEVVNK